MTSVKFLAKLNAVSILATEIHDACGEWTSTVHPLSQLHTDIVRLYDATSLLVHSAVDIQSTLTLAQLHGKSIGTLKQSYVQDCLTDLDTLAQSLKRRHSAQLLDALGVKDLRWPLSMPETRASVKMVRDYCNGFHVASVRMQALLKGQVASTTESIHRPSPPLPPTSHLLRRTSLPVPTWRSLGPPVSEVSSTAAPKTTTMVLPSRPKPKAVRFLSQPSVTTARTSRTLPKAIPWPDGMRHVHERSQDQEQGSRAAVSLAMTSSHPHSGHETLEHDDGNCSCDSCNSTDTTSYDMDSYSSGLSHNHTNNHNEYGGHAGYDGYDSYYGYNGQAQSDDHWYHQSRHENYINNYNNNHHHNSNNDNHGSTYSYDLYSPDTGQFHWR